MRVILALIAMTASAGAQDEPVRAALKRIGPAYMCGANFEYVEALGNLKQELLKVGLAGFAADAAVESVRKAAEANEAERLRLTAKDCAEKYAR